MEESHSLAARVWALLKHRTEMAQSLFLMRTNGAWGNSKMSGYEEVFVCSELTWFSAVAAGHLKAVPAPCRSCHEHSWRPGSLTCSPSTSILVSRVGCRHLVHPSQSLLYLILFGKDAFWLFGLSTTLGGIQGFALSSFWEGDLQEMSCTSFHAQNSKALSVEK